MLFVALRSSGTPRKHEGKYDDPRNHAAYESSRMLELGLAFIDEDGRLTGRHSVTLSPKETLKLVRPTRLETFLKEIDFVESLKRVQTVVAHDVWLTMNILRSEVSRSGLPSEFDALSKVKHVECTMNLAFRKKYSSTSRIELQDLYPRLFKTSFDPSDIIAHVDACIECYRYMSTRNSPDEPQSLRLLDMFTSRVRETHTDTTAGVRAVTKDQHTPVTTDQPPPQIVQFLDATMRVLNIHEHEELPPCSQEVTWWKYLGTLKREGWITHKSLYDAYTWWSKEHGEKPQPSGWFSRLIAEFLKDFKLERKRTGASKGYTWTEWDPECPVPDWCNDEHCAVSINDTPDVVDDNTNEQDSVHEPYNVSVHRPGYSVSVRVDDAYETCVDLIKFITVYIGVQYLLRHGFEIVIIVVLILLYSRA